MFGLQLAAVQAVLLVASASGQLTAEGDTGRDPLVRAFEVYLERVTQTSFEYRGKTDMYYEQGFSDGNRNFAPKERVFETEFLLRQDGRCYYFDAIPRYWYQGMKPSVERSAFDGEIVQALSANPGAPLSGARGPKASSDSHTVLDVKYETGSFMRGQLIGTDLLSILRTHAATVEVRPESEEISGVPCRVIRINDGKTENIVWVDPSIGFAPRQWHFNSILGESDSGDTGLWRVTNIEYQSVDGQWVPVKGTLYHQYSPVENGRSGKAEPEWTMEVSFSNLKYGAPYSQRDFVIAFPPDTVVTDSSTGTVMKAIEGGTLVTYVDVPSSLQDFSLGADLALPRETESAEGTGSMSLHSPGDAGELSEKNSRWRVAVAMVALVGVFAVVYRLRRFVKRP